mmetsp:Transcript_43264/g.117132  ORF Transcript_43264/g.117132 Transcript_43264/m.117132 type:complete len:334 (-) Transcript_43264:1493-2494(-)
MRKFRHCSFKRSQPTTTPPLCQVIANAATYVWMNVLSLSHGNGIAIEVAGDECVRWFNKKESAQMCRTASLKRVRKATNAEMLVSNDPHYMGSTAKGETEDMGAGDGASENGFEECAAAMPDKEEEARSVRIEGPPTPEGGGSSKQLQAYGISPTNFGNPHHRSLYHTYGFHQAMVLKIGRMYMQRIFALRSGSGNFGGSGLHEGNGMFDVALLSAWFSCSFNCGEGAVMSQRSRANRDELLEAARAFLQTHPGLEGFARAWVESLLSELPMLESIPTGCFYRTSNTQGEWDLYTYVVGPVLNCQYLIRIPLTIIDWNISFPGLPQVLLRRAP